VKIVHDTKRVSDTTVEETYSMGGGHVGGYVHIRPDGTYLRVAPSGKKYTGKWTVETTPYMKGIVLWGGDDPKGFGDLIVQPRPGDEVVIQSFPAGGAGWNGWRAKDTAGLDLEDKTGPAFFQRTWALERRRSVAGLKRDFGQLTVRADGTWLHQDGVESSKGTWAPDPAIDGIRIVGLRGEGAFKFQRSGEDKTRGYLAGIEPANYHIAYHATPR
jgi:hypothetical protein